MSTADTTHSAPTSERRRGGRPSGPAVVLTVAGSDPAGGAGLQLDLKVFTALGADGAAVPAVLTVQGTSGLSRVECLEPGLVAEQLRGVFAARRVAAVKTGALGTAAIVRAVAEVLAAHPEVPVVCDPVFEPSRTAVPGLRLLEAAALPDLVQELLPRTAVVTPNLREATLLSGIQIGDRETMLAAALRILEGGAAAVLLKGGHLNPAGRSSTDLLLARGEQPLWLEGKRIPRAAAVHGTGCALSSALAVHLARGLPLDAATRHAKAALHWWLGKAVGGRLQPLS